MSAACNFFKFLATRQIFSKSPSAVTSCSYSWIRRNFADKTKTDVTSKQVMVQGTENEERLRVRRARPADVPRVLRFVREHALVAWPALASQNHVSGAMLNDYVSRALAQGHSMLAEQHDTHRGWSHIKGLALGVALCPWDATLLEKWALCVRCNRSRQLIHFTAHCLRAPALHDKYNVHNIMQVILIVPPETAKSTEIVHVLAKNVIQRGRDVGFPLLRFDVTNDSLAKSLENLQLKKEWQLNYEILPDAIRERKPQSRPNISTKRKEARTESKSSEFDKQSKGNYVAVYSTFTDVNK